MTLEEWAQLPEDEEGELVDGLLVEEEVPGPIHELALTWLTTRFGVWLEECGAGFVFGSETKLKVTSRRGRKPDVVVYLPGGAVPPPHGLLTEPPDLLVEIVTPTPRDERRDRVDKAEEYQALGVRWYWLLDPALGILEIFELDSEGEYKRKIVAKTGQITEIPGCPGLVIDMDKLWSHLARLKPR